MTTAITSRTSEILSYIRTKIALRCEIEELSRSYASASPFPHLILNDMWDPNVLDGLVSDIPDFSSDRWVHDRNETIVKSNIRSSVDLGDKAFDFISVINSAGFLYFLSEITGVKALLPDPYLTGAGYSVMQNGGKFDVHADRNTDHYAGLERRIIMLIYLNKNWSPENGGCLELWDDTGTKCLDSIQPIFNRTVIFEIADKNFHAVSKVVAAAQQSRKCFTSYFHTTSNHVVPHYSIYAPKVYQGVAPSDKWARAKLIAKDMMPPVLTRHLKSLKKNGAGA